MRAFSASLRSAASSSNEASRSIAFNASARYIAPLSRFTYPSFRASREAIVLFPAPAGPSMAIVNLRVPCPSFPLSVMRSYRLYTLAVAGQGRHGLTRTGSVCSNIYVGTAALSCPVEPSSYIGTGKLSPPAPESERGNLPRPHCVRVLPHSPYLPDPKRTRLLLQPTPALVAQQLAVIVLRRIQTQRPIQKKLPRRRLQQIRPTHDLRDPHRRIVDDDRQLIGRHIVAPPHNEVPKIPPRNHPLLLQPQIRKANLLPLRHPKPPIHSARLNPYSGAGLGCPAQAKPSRPRHNIRRPARPRIHRLIIQTIRRPRR